MARLWRNHPLKERGEPCANLPPSGCRSLMGLESLGKHSADTPREVSRIILGSKLHQLPEWNPSEGHRTPRTGILFEQHPGEGLMLLISEARVHRGPPTSLRELAIAGQRAKAGSLALHPR
jgi:hypothetical protein